MAKRSKPDAAPPLKARRGPRAKVPPAAPAGPPPPPPIPTETEMLRDSEEGISRVQWNHARRAVVLVDALYHGDPAAGDKWEVSTRAIRYWRRMLWDDTELQKEFNRVREQFEAEWAGDSAKAQKMAIGYIGRAAAQRFYHPEYIDAVAGAFQVLHEAELDKQMIDMRREQMNNAGADKDPEAD